MKILDRTAPVGEILYESTAVGYLYGEESGQEVFWNGKEMEDVFTKQKILSGNRVTIGPWDLRILEGL